MSESSQSMPVQLRHRGRFGQVAIYLGKLFRMFVYQSDWKVLPMSAVIAGLVSMVVRRDFFLTMEGTLKGSFALTCVCIWNGCFNSIQVICRERNVIKREHRSGMHISSYVVSHMIYQACLCLLQVGVTLYVSSIVGVQYPKESYIFSFFYIDIGVTLFLITFASDMLSLLISSVAKTTTGAMTVMPFVLIFQLVFSGGFFSLPAWSKPLADFTVSNYGIQCIAAQSNYNNLPMVTGWNTIVKMKDNDIGGTITLGQVLDILDSDAPEIEKIRSQEISGFVTVGQLCSFLLNSEQLNSMRDVKLPNLMTYGDLLNEFKTNAAFSEIRDLQISGIPLGSLLDLFTSSDDLAAALSLPVGDGLSVGTILDTISSSPILDEMSDQPIGGTFTLGQIIDFIASNKDIQANRDQSFSAYFKVSDILSLIGEERVKTIIEQKTMEASRVEAYTRSFSNIAGNWLVLLFFSLVYAGLTIIILEFIDKDKR